MGHGLAGIHDALVASFTQADLRQLVMYQLDANTDDFIGDNVPMEQYVHELLRWAERTGRIAELVLAVRGAQPQNLVLQSLTIPRKMTVNRVMSHNDYSNLDAKMGEMAEAIRGLRRDMEQTRATLAEVDQRLESVSLWRSWTITTVAVAAAVEIVFALVIILELMQRT